jgi:putative YpdA family bacillithiol system oxidoreductase
MHDLIVVGAGPAGLSAACHAKKNGLDVLVLEKGELANTVFDYQKHKHVMAEPGMIPLRSDVPFQAGTREAILDGWDHAVKDTGLTIKRPEEARDVTKADGGFVVKTNKGEHHGRHVILAIGIQGNPRKLNVPGENLPHVVRIQDPFIYENEDILMIGAGDAAIEGVLALCERNRVSVLNRNAEFYRLKDALDREINQKIASGQVTAYHSATVERIEEGYTYVKLSDGTVKVKADLVCVRIGAELPRPFLQKIGVTFASSDPTAAPVLSKHYETAVPGLFMIGAVAGYNLIKQGMNQGYDVVEHILGREVQPVDEPIIQEKLKMFLGSTEDRLKHILTTVPLLSGVAPQVLRELLLESTLHQVSSGTVIFREHDFSDSFYAILDGSVGITFEAQAPGDKPIALAKGEFFGELSLLSGRRRSATVTAAESSVLLEIPRKAMLRLMNLEPSVKRGIDESYIVRAFRTHLLPDADYAFLRELASRAQIRSFKSGEVIFRQGDTGDAFYLVRNGSVKVSKKSGLGDKEVVVSYVPAGRYFGEMALLDPQNPKRTATVTATKYTETIQLMQADFQAILRRYPEFERSLRESAKKALVRGQEVALREVALGHVIGEMMKEGVFEGTDVLLIDENKCVRCDQCVNACAGTHGGQTRLYRTEGIIFANLLVPTSCRHCENPLCLTDCLAGDAILRDPKGEVFIRDNCIGCGNCAKNCPYGNILMMHEKKEPERGPLDRLLAIIGLKASPAEEEGPTKAVKCDLCRGDNQGPACVRICPTGAAMRVSPEEYFKQVGVGAL